MLLLYGRRKKVRRLPFKPFYLSSLVSSGFQPTSGWFLCQSLSFPRYSVGVLFRHSTRHTNACHGSASLQLLWETLVAHERHNFWMKQLLHVETFKAYKKPFSESRLSTIQHGHPNLEEIEGMVGFTMFSAPTAQGPSPAMAGKSLTSSRSFSCLARNRAYLPAAESSRHGW